MKKWKVFAALVIIAAPTGYGRESPADDWARSPCEWPGGPTIDPAGDVVRLAGRWRRPRDRPGERHDLVFDGGTVTYDDTFAIAPGRKVERHVDCYNYILNSSSPHRVIRLLGNVKSGDPNEFHDIVSIRCRHYRFEGGELVLYDSTEGEFGPDRYARVQPEGN